MPPISAWWPRLPTKNRISRAGRVEHRRDHGHVRQMRAAVERVVERDHVAGLQRVARDRAAPSARSRPSRRDAPGRAARWPPARRSASKIAQEKSSRSLMLTLIDVFCSTAPVCSATFMNRLLNSSSSTGSGRPLPAGTRVAQRLGAAQDHVVERGDLGGPAGLDHRGRVRLADQRRAGDAVAGQQLRRGRTPARRVLGPPVKIGTVSIGARRARRRARAASPHAPPRRPRSPRPRPPRPRSGAPAWRSRSARGAPR